MNQEIIRASDAAIKTKFQIALQRSGLLYLEKKIPGLVYNEDTKDEISDLLDSLNVIKKKIVDVHKSGKADAWAECTRWDANKNVFLKKIEAIEKGIRPKYVQLCNDLLEKERKQKVELERVKSIKEGIEQNLLLFAKRIGDSSSMEELHSIERIINLERGRKAKYQEFLDLANEKFDILTESIKEQKDKLKDIEDKKALIKEAIENEDVEKMEELQSKIDEIKEEVVESKIEVQTDAVSSLLDEKVVNAEVIYPVVKTKRVVWKSEVFDLEQIFKKQRSVLDISLNSRKVSTLYKDMLSNVNKDEIIVDGIRFYKHRTY